MNKNHPFTAQILPPHAREQSARSLQREEGEALFETLAVALIAFWLMALGFGFTMGGYIHVLLFGAIVMTLLHFKQARRVRYASSGTFHPKEIK